MLELSIICPSHDSKLYIHVTNTLRSAALLVLSIICPKSLLCIGDYMRAGTFDGIMLVLKKIHVATTI